MHTLTMSTKRFWLAPVLCGGLALSGCNNPQVQADINAVAPYACAIIVSAQASTLKLTSAESQTLALGANDCAAYNAAVAAGKDGSAVFTNPAAVASVILTALAIAQQYIGNKATAEVPADVRAAAMHLKQL